MTENESKSLHRRVMSRLRLDVIEGAVNKLTIVDSDLYVRTGWLEGKIVYIDMSLSHGQEDKDKDVFYMSRSWVESSCRQASRLLQQGVSVEEIISSWMGVEGYPKGVCYQLACIVKSPLHAAAVLLEKNIDRWRAEHGA